jgi:hypothetical protein
VNLVADHAALNIPHDLVALRQRQPDLLGPQIGDWSRDGAYLVRDRLPTVGGEFELDCPFHDGTLLAALH